MGRAWYLAGLLVELQLSQLRPARIGLGRVLVLLDFPIALVAIALVLVAMDALPRRCWLVGGPAIALCAVVALPGVVDQADLDAKPVNVIPAIGVVLALALTVAAGRTAPRPPGVRHLERIVAAIVVLAILALPWIAAELGFHLPGGIYLTDELYQGHPAVHLGHHHGLDGTLLVVTAILLWPVRLGSLRRCRLLHAYLAVMVAYGLVNATQDFWTEQIHKRGWTNRLIPDALHPSVSWVWLVILLLAGAIYALFGPRGQRP